MADVAAGVSDKEFVCANPGEMTSAGNIAWMKRTLHNH